MYFYKGHIEKKNVYGKMIHNFSMFCIHELLSNAAIVAEVEKRYGIDLSGSDVTVVLIEKSHNPVLR